MGCDEILCLAAVNSAVGSLWLMERLDERRICDRHPISMRSSSSSARTKERRKEMIFVFRCMVGRKPTR